MKWSLLLCLILVFGCGKTVSRKDAQSQANVNGIFAASQIKVQVYYEPGAEPYVDQALVLSIWDLLQKNLEALFLKRTPSPAISVPRSLADMTLLQDSKKTSWSLEEVMSLANSQVAAAATGTSVFKVFFLNGYAQESKGIIGFNISGTQVIAIFKDVIRSTGSEATAVPKYVEQATLIHEMGHALGLVNNGLPMSSGHHQDTAHGAHCTNPKCVMYYTNEGSSSMISFIQEVISKQDIVMFDQQCLSDAQNYQK